MRFLLLVEVFVLNSMVVVLRVGVRDYIHVVDLALGHVASLKKLEQNCGCRVGAPIKMP